MTGNSFGHSFRITTFGESHGVACGVIMDGCPAGIKIELSKIQDFMNRRRPGQNPWTSPRQEPDQVKCLSGLEQGVTLGSPITLIVYNQDARPSDYQQLSQGFRPSHADHSYWLKYGLRPRSGGGRLSARETLARVAAAGVAQQVLQELHPETSVLAYVESVHDLALAQKYPPNLSTTDIEKSPLRCPDLKLTDLMIKKIEQVMKEGDSLGGTICCQVTNPPKGLGEPVFDKLHADLGKGVMSLPACRAFEIGDGFAATQLLGSQHNDLLLQTEGQIKTKSNHAGGVVGGITNGETLCFRCAFKPTSTIKIPQETVDEQGSKLMVFPKNGRHDPCVLPRAVPLVEAMTLLVLLDHRLRHFPL